MSVQRRYTRAAFGMDFKTPPANVVLGVWYEPEQRIVEAVFDGNIWRARDGEPLAVQPSWWYPAA